MTEPLHQPVPVTLRPSRTPMLMIALLGSAIVALGVGLYLVNHVGTGGQVQAPGRLSPSPSPPIAALFSPAPTPTVRVLVTVTAPPARTVGDAPSPTPSASPTSRPSPTRSPSSSPGPLRPVCRLLPVC